MPRKRNNSQKTQVENSQPLSSTHRATLTSYTRSEDLPVLRPGSVDSVLLFREALTHKLRSEFGRYACFMTTGNPYQPVLPPKPVSRPAVIRSERTRLKLPQQAVDPPFPVLPAGTLIFDDESDADLCRREQMKKYHEEHSRMSDIEEKMFQIIIGNISDESLQKLSEDQDYRSAFDEQDPYILLSVIDRTHNRSNSGWVVTDKVKATTQIPEWSIQRPTEQDLAFKKRFNACKESFYRTVPGSNTFFDEQYMTVLFINGLSDARHSVFKAEKNNIITQESEVVREARYPKTIEEAYHLLTLFRNPTAKSPSMPNVAVSVKSSTPPVALVATDKRHQKGESKTEHKSSKTKSDKGKSERGKNESKPNAKYPCVTCSILGLPEDRSHYSNQCPNLSRAQQLCRDASGGSSLLAAVGFGEPMSESGVALVATEPKCSELVLKVGGSLRPTDIVNDGGSTCNIFKNPDVVSNVTEQSPFYIGGVGGNITSSSRGVYEKVFKVNLSKDAPCNILSQAIIEDTVRITPGARFCYNETTYAYHLYIPNVGEWHFERRDDLGGLRVSSGIICTNAALVTMSENLRQYPADQRQKIKEVLELQRRADYISSGGLANAINTGNMINSPVTSTDVHRTKSVVKVTVPELMGKATKKKSKLLPIEPSSHKAPRDVNLIGDIFFVDNHAFLLTMSNFAYSMAAYLGIESGRRAASNIWKCLSLMFSAYVSRGFKVASFTCDPERGFESNRENIQNQGIVFNSNSSDAKLPSLDRRIRTAKERNRATRSGVPFKLFGALLVYSVLNSIRCINLFPCAGSPNCPPRELFSGMKTDVKRDFPIAFGDYCLCYDTSNAFINSSRPRMEECIALIPTGNRDGDVTFLNLRTGRIITRNRFDVLPTPDSVITHINRQYDSVVGKPYRETAVFRSDAQIFSDDYDGPFDDAIEMDSPEEELNTPLGGDAIADNNIDTEEVVIMPMSDNSTVSDEVVTPTAPITVPITGETIIHSIPVNTDVGSADVVPSSDFPVQSSRYPQRDNRTTWKNRVFMATVKSAVKMHGRAALISMLKEIKSIAVDKAAFIPVNPRHLSYDEMKRIIPSFLFLKEKFDPNGNFEKLKSRLVAGGHMQNKSEYEVSETSSPCVATQSVLITAAIAAKERRHVVTADIGVAYLNANMPEDKKILMRLSRDHSEMLCWLKPEYRIFMRDDGTMIVKLSKALYGCVESAKLWYDHIANTLKSQGFAPNPIDICVFNKIVDGSQITVCIHVDDLMVTSVNNSACNELLRYLKNVYKDIVATEGRIHKYLGMLFDFSVEGKCAISMPHFIIETIAKAKVDGVAATPATEHLFQVRENAVKLEGKHKEEFHSLIMSLQYLAKRVRPEILCPVVFLSTRVQHADQDDWSKLIRVMKYLNGSKELGIILEPSEGILSVRSYVDASFAVHADFKSHTGIVITFGGGGIFFCSIKQKLNTTSSTEAELVGIADALPQIIQCREYLIHQGYSVAPATLYQDNTSTIQLVKNGRSNSSRTRHINIRFFFVKDRVDAKELQLQHMPTDDMIADILTKPLQGEKFRELRAKLLNWY